jgi:hypothetical protein
MYIDIEKLCIYTCNLLKELYFFCGIYYLLLKKHRIYKIKYFICIYYGRLKDKATKIFVLDLRLKIIDDLQIKRLCVLCKINILDFTSENY